MNDTEPSSSHVPELRRRAQHLCELAAQVESALAMSLPDRLPPGRPADRHRALTDRLVERSLHQLHCAADDLRATAHGFRQQADALESGLAA